MTVSVPPAEQRRGGIFKDTWVVARRGLKHMIRQPEALSDVTIQPIMFVLLFAYVFGGAIAVQGSNYREFLMGGIFAQTIVFGAFNVAIALAYDRANGAIDRFRSLPMARGSVLAGHALASLVRSVLPITLMSLCGLIVGWRIRDGVVDAVSAYALMFLFTFAIIWVGVLMGSLLPSPEAVQGFAFAIIFPITFVASTFVPLNTLPGPLQTVAAWNPVTSMSDALRELFGNRRGFVPEPNADWPVRHPVAYTFIWIVRIIVVCAPLAVRQYSRTIDD